MNSNIDSKRAPIPHPGVHSTFLRTVSTTTLVFGIILLSYSLASKDIAIGKYGGISTYGLSGIVSVFLILFSVLMNIGLKNIKPAVIGLVYFSIALKLPVIIAKIPMFPFNYEGYTNVLYIFYNGHININFNQYQSWPGLFILGAEIRLITNVGIYLMHTLWILPFFFLPLSYLLMKNITKDKFIPLIAIILSWISGYGIPVFHPGVLAGILQHVGTYILFRLTFIKRQENLIKFGAILAIITGILVFTHFLSSIFWITLVISFLVYSVVYQDKKIRNMLIVVVVLFIVFQYYWIFSNNYTTHLFAQRIQEIFALSRAVEATERWVRIATTTVTLHAHILRIKSYFMYSVVTLYGLLDLVVLIDFFNKKAILKEHERKYVSFISFIAIPSHVIIVPTLAGGYGGEIASRLFSGTKYLLTYLSSLAIKKRRIIMMLIPILFVFTYVSILTSYGNMAYDYIHPTEIQSITFSNYALPKNETISPVYSIVWTYVGKAYGFRTKPLYNAHEIQRYYGATFDMQEKIEKIKPQYVSISEREKRATYFFSGKFINMQSAQLECSAIYSAGSTKTYHTLLYVKLE